MEERIKEKKYKISAEVVDRVTGVQYFDNIRMIRLKSYNHNLLIMEDYMPVIGEVVGFVELVFDDKTVEFNPIHGFYMHKKNKFSLLIENHTGEIPDAEEKKSKKQQEK